MLTVWYEHNRVGDIATVQGRWQFQYSNEWLKHSLAFPLSPQFPLQEAPFMDSADDKRVEWFFENLLPEGGIREALARNASISDQDVLGLLTQYGEECAGALSLLPQGDEYTNDTQYESLTFDALRNYISNAEETPLLAANELLHMSLAGVQNKLGIRYVNGEIYLPINNTPSSHILKPDNDNKVFAFCPANEYFCMRLARQMQLPVPEVDLLHIPEAIYIIERFDRVVSDTRIRRLHQVDLCQLLNKWVGYKYESHGGVTFSDVFQSLENVFQPAVDKGSILRWIIFNYLIGNNDAHAKNISFMVSHRGISLAPFYDLLCVSTYLPNSDMAMSIGDEIKPGWIEAIQWKQLAQQAGVSNQLMHSFLLRLSQSIENEVQQLITKDEKLNRKEREFIQTKIMPEIKQRCKFLNDALSEF